MSHIAPSRAVNFYSHASRHRADILELNNGANDNVLTGRICYIEKSLEQVLRNRRRAVPKFLISGGQTNGNDLPDLSVNWNCAYRRQRYSLFFRPGGFRRGPVTAVIEARGERAMKAEGGAWVVVAPPSYAPEIESFTTWYDQALNVAVRNFSPQLIKDVPSFTRDIYPILKRSDRY